MEREEGGPDAALALPADWPRQIGGAASAGTARGAPDPAPRSAAALTYKQLNSATRRDTRV